MELLAERDQIPGFADVQEGPARLAGDGRWTTVVFRFRGVDVPENLARCPHTAAAIAQAPTVGGETRRFEEGKPLLFDDTFVRTAWNEDAPDPG